METINLGVDDGLPPVDWGAVVEKLDHDSAPDADVVVEGDATRVTDPAVVARLAKAWADGGWPAKPDPSGSGITAPFNAPGQGPSPWHVYRIEPRSATVVLGVEPGGLTRFRFSTRS